MSGSSWKSGLFGCFSDMKLCIVTFIVPCYTLGKNAQGVGDDCLLYGLLSFLGLQFGPVIRWRVRQERAISGSMLMDVLVYVVCPCCALVQEAKELGWSFPQELNDIGRTETEINRQ